jgi:uncharacterized LabA/DUF88 family protein
MRRVIAFIDGFNLYHALKSMPLERKFLWLDIQKLASAFITENETLVKTLFFTTVVPWSLEKAAKHQRYTEALRSTGVEIVLGEFHRREQKCPLCNRLFQRYEEKQTDVHIAVQMLKHAQHDQFDKAMLVSGDSDLVPAVRLVRELHPDKSIVIGIPSGRRAEQLKNVSQGHLKIRPFHIMNNQLSSVITLPNGHRIISPYQ